MSREFANLPLTPVAAEAAIRRYRLSGRTARATFLFLIGAVETRTEAAKQAQVDRAVLSRVLARMTVVEPCGDCGHPVKRIATKEQ